MPRSPPSKPTIVGNPLPGVDNAVSSNTGDARLPKRGKGTMTGANWLNETERVIREIEGLISIPDVFTNSNYDFKGENIMGAVDVGDNPCVYMLHGAFPNGISTMYINFIESEAVRISGNSEYTRDDMFNGETIMFHHSRALRRRFGCLSETDPTVSTKTSLDMFRYWSYLRNQVSNACHDVADTNWR